MEQTEMLQAVLALRTQVAVEVEVVMLLPPRMALAVQAALASSLSNTQ
jgi:hypothetical protein